MARSFRDGAGATYNATTNQFETVPYGSVMTNPLSPGAGQTVTGTFFEMFNFGSTEGYRAKADNSVAGEMRDCAECHVGGGMGEYVIDPAKATSGTYSPDFRTSLRDFDFNGMITGFNALIDIFNADPAKRGDVVVQDYAQTGVLEMDCLICHMDGYDWSARKEAVRNGEFDASRPVGAGLAKGVKNGTTVFYNYSALRTGAGGELILDLSAKLKGTPGAGNCAACHQSQYNVDWKKRGEQWLPGTDVHGNIGCMGCHERTDKVAPVVGTEGVINDKQGLCDPAKGGASAFDALWNKLDGKNFKNCAGCHEPATTPAFNTYAAPYSGALHAARGLTAKIAFDKNGAPASHLDLIDCTACHIKKTFDGGAFVDGTGADAEGRVALHDEPQVGKDMSDGNALYWDNGKLYAANLLTSFFIRDMNGMDDANNGLDANNDGRNAGMDPLLQTHINDVNLAKGLKAVTMEKNADGSWVNETEIGQHLTALKGDGKGTATADLSTPVQGGVKQLLGISDPNNDKKLLPKLSFLMVPFKATHNIVPTSTYARGKNGCTDCHGANKGFYNGSYPILGNMSGADAGNYRFRFKSNQVTAFTKVNGLADVTDSHPNVVTKKGDRTVPVPMLTKFDTPYTKDVDALPNQTLRNIDRSEVIYEKTFQTRDSAWYTTITGAAPTAACVDATSPFYCANPSGVAGEEFKSLATSTKGWLLKIEVRPAGDGDPSHITFRTAQLGKDNAASMAEAFAALPATFTSNADFTVSQSGGALTITAAAGKEVRISPQADVAPFGLKGKLWKADPIVRGTASYGGRDAWVAYLDTLTDPAAFGVGVAPVATIVAGSVPSNAYTTTPLTLQAAAGQVVNGREVAAGTTYYGWSYTDGTKNPDGTLKEFPIAATRSAAVTFGTPGTKTVKLTVTDEEGKSAVAYASVIVATQGLSVAVPQAVRVNAAAGFTFGNIPAGTYQLKVAWGDGGINSYFSGFTTAKSHTYKYLGTKTLSAYAYDANGVALSSLTATVTVTP